jgi:hypothetical protein
MECDEHKLQSNRLIVALTPEQICHTEIAPRLAGILTKLDRPAAAVAHLLRVAERGGLVLAGIEGLMLKALLVLELPGGLSLYPIITLGYNAGSAALGIEMMRATTEWCRARGFAHCHAVTDGARDGAYARLCRRIGWRVVKRKTFHTFALPQEKTGNEPAMDVRGLGVSAE